MAMLSRMLSLAADIGSGTSTTARTMTSKRRLTVNVLPTASCVPNIVCAISVVTTALFAPSSAVAGSPPTNE